MSLAVEIPSFNKASSTDKQFDDLNDEEVKLPEVTRWIKTSEKLF
jgi:hypothetical protein